MRVSWSLLDLPPSHVPLRNLSGREQDRVMSGAQASLPPSFATPAPTARLHPYHHRGPRPPFQQQQRGRPYPSHHHQQQQHQGQGGDKVMPQPGPDGFFRPAAPGGFHSSKVFRRREPLEQQQGGRLGTQAPPPRWSQQQQGADAQEQGREQGRGPVRRQSLWTNPEEAQEEGRQGGRKWVQLGAVPLRA